MANYDVETSVHELLANSVARAVLDRYVPGVGENEWVRTMPGIRLSMILKFASELSRARQEALLAELGALERVPFGEVDDEPWPGVRHDYEGEGVPQGSARRVDSTVGMSPAGATAHRTVEFAFAGPSHGNPFLDVEFGADVTHAGRTTRWPGFYDGDGVWRVRFLPEAGGSWTVRTASSARSLDAIESTVEVGGARASDHGPVRIDGWGFRHADGTRALPLGTTCYAWTHQGDALEEQTLATLAASPWTKVRMCVFPKSMPYNENEPERYPFEFADPGAPTGPGAPSAGRMRDGRSYDRRRFDPAYFRHLEGRISQLGDLGIDADLILFHPYDRWGYATLGRQADEHYLRYVIARLAAFPNVWWAMANEFDLMTKSDDDWHRLGRLVRDLDPVGHPRSIHNCATFFDHTADWVTHASVQKVDTYRTAENTGEWRDRWGKPVVLDEIAYEGNLAYGWGNITGEELVRRHWEAACRGGWGGHGETFLDPADVLWWAKGGVLKGTSAPRIAFLREVLTDAPGDLVPANGGDAVLAVCGADYALAYWSFMQPAECRLRLGSGQWRLDVLDTWGMTVTPLAGTYTSNDTIPLPGRQYIAVRAHRVR